MTRVDFYVLSGQDPQQRLLFACRLAAKALAQRHEIYLHMSDERSAHAVDELLWSFDPASFVPHCLAANHSNEPVTIGWGNDPGPHHDVLINLDLSVPGFIGRFNRVGEIVVQHPGYRDALRENYRYYRERGYPLTKHDIAIQ